MQWFYVETETTIFWEEESSTQLNIDFFIDEDLNQEVVTAKAVEFISDDYGSNEVASEENETNLSSADSDDGYEESEFPVHEEKEEREPSEVL